MKRKVTTFSLLFVSLLLLVLWNLNTGSVSISPKDMWLILNGKGMDLTNYHIIWDIRLPRLLAALFLGGALAVSGFLLQTFFHNPIAGPYVLGISSGAKLFVAIAMIFFLERGLVLSSASMVLAAFMGSMLVMGFVLLLSRRVKKMSLLVVCGIMVGYICSAITDFFVTFAQDSNIVNLHNWSLGTFSGTSWDDLRWIVALVVMAFVFCLLLTKPMQAYMLGESYAKNMGVNITSLRVGLILLSSILSATVTAFAGPISFVGIAVPHLIKQFLGTAKPYLMLPACFLGGAVITLFCDGIARCLFAPTELSISSVTAVFLVPVVIVMMVRKKEES